MCRPSCAAMSGPKWTRADWDWANLILYRRCGYSCEKCGRALANSVERHHRQRRAIGGDRLSNLLMLHSGCHKWITEHPEEARANGWIVSAYVADPSLVPVLIQGQRYLLDDDGGRLVVA